MKRVAETVTSGKWPSPGSSGVTGPRPAGLAADSPPAEPEGAERSGIVRGLGRDRRPIPAYRTLAVEVRSAVAGVGVVRLPAGPYLASADGALLPGALAVVADACCGSAVASALPPGGAALTSQLRVE